MNSFQKHHDPIRLRIGQGRKNYRMNDRKDSSVGADSEAQRKSRDCGKSRRLAQNAASITNVLQQLLKPYDTPNFPRFFYDAIDIAEFQSGRVPGFLRRHPAVKVLPRL